MAPDVPLTAYKRVPFVDEDGATWVFVLEDWDDATFLMHIRAHPGDTGTPIIALENATAGMEGISASIDPSYVFIDPDTGEETTSSATLVLCQIDEASLDALALGTPTDKAVILFYDLHVTPSGGVKRVAAQGKFIIQPGVTI